MRSPVAGTVMCAIAAVALLVGGFTPWFSSGGGVDDDLSPSGRAAAARRAYQDAYYEVDELVDDRAPLRRRQLRASFGLVSGELCVRLDCQPAKYTGTPGLADDAFAWLGRATLGAALAGVALLLAVAAAARTRRRSILRGWAATVAAAAGGLGGAFAASWALEQVAPRVDRGMGLMITLVGCALAGAGAAWPWGRGDGSRGRRFALAGAIALLATLAWITLVEHAWWRSGRSLDLLRVSPLGVEVCDEDGCKLSTALGVTSSLRALSAVTALAAGALLVPAFGAATRIARGVRPGAWAWAAAATAVVALATGAATWALYPSSEVMAMAWGLPLFLVASAGVAATSIAGALTTRGADLEQLAAAPAPLPAGAVAPGERPMLAPLAPQASAGPSPWSPPRAEPSSRSPYAPPSDSPSPYASPSDSPSPYAPPSDSPPPSPYAPPSHAPLPSPYAPRPASGASPYAPAAGAAAAAAAAVAAMRGPRPAPPIAIATGAGTETVARTETETAAETETVAETAPPVSPAAPAASAPVPLAVPAAFSRPSPSQPLRRPSPTCPSCRVPTLWHGKRSAWWCSTCKQTL